MTSFASIVMALGALGLAFASPHIAEPDETAQLRLASASGVVQIANSHAGQAMMSAGAMRPGQSVSGLALVGNAGDASGRFSVRPFDLQDAAGANGGLLSRELELVLADATDPSAPTTVYTGTPDGFDAVALGDLAPGEQRAFRLTATLPTTAGNRFQGARLSFGLEWIGVSATPVPLRQPAPTTPAAPAPSTPTTPPTTADPTGDALADALGLPSARSCVRRRTLTLRLKAPGGVRVVSATVAVNGRTKARVSGARTGKPVMLRRLPERRITIRVSVRAANGRSYRSARSYRTCR